MGCKLSKKHIKFLTLEDEDR